MRKILDILRGINDIPCDHELMEGFQFDPVSERRPVTKAEVLEWAGQIDDECRKTRVCLDLALIGLHRKAA